MSFYYWLFNISRLSAAPLPPLNLPKRLIPTLILSHSLTLSLSLSPTRQFISSQAKFTCLCFLVNQISFFQSSLLIVVSHTLPNTAPSLSTQTNSPSLLCECDKCSLHRKTIHREAASSLEFPSQRTTLAMNSLLLLFVVSSFIFRSLFLEARPVKTNSHIVVMGFVYCDICHNNSFTKHSYFLPGNIYLNYPDSSFPLFLVPSYVFQIM